MPILRMTREEYEKKYGQKPTSYGITPISPKVAEAPQEKRGIVEKIGGFLGIERFGKALGQGAFQFTKEKRELDKLLEAGQISPEEYESITTGGISSKEIVGSAVSTGALLVPGVAKGAPLGLKALAGGATGYGLDVGAKLQAEKPTGEALKPGVGTVVGTLLPVLGSIFGKINPKRLEEINLRMTPTEKQLMARQGKDIPAFLAKKKIVGTPEMRYQKVRQIYDSLEEKIGKTIKESNVKFSKNDVLNSVRQIPEQFKDDITGYDEATKVTNKVLKFLQSKTPMEVEGDLLNTYKRNLFKRAYSKNNTDVTNEAMHAVASTFKEMLDKAIPGLQKINKEYGNVILARKILFKAISRSQIGLTGKILGTVAGGGVGAAAGGGIGAAVGAIVGEKVAEKALGTATRSALGAGIQSIAEKIPTDKLGNLQITRKALIRLLQGAFGE